MAKGGTSDPEAYQLYLKGRYQWEKRTSEALEKAKDYFNQAIEKDPGYAMPYVGLASYYVTAPDYEPLRRTETAPKAIAAAEKALAIDDTLADAHAAIGSASQDLWNWERVEREFKRALEINPNQVIAHQWYGLYLAEIGRSQEAIPHFKRALELDPAESDCAHESRRWIRKCAPIRSGLGTVQTDPRNRSELPIRTLQPLANILGYGKVRLVA